MIDRETAERIKDAADIVEVVSDYVHLVRRGANYMGLCPFHNERTPSFSVNKRKNFCFCFSCKQGGSPVNFIMKKEGLSYHDALLHLAKKYGIEVQERELTDQERQEQSEREAMFVANEWAMNKMAKDLYDTQEGVNIGLSYIYGRGVTEEAAKAFRLGYALDNGNELVTAAKKQGIEVEVLKKLGLVGTSQRGNDYDRFHGRVIFPVMNSAGKVVAFGGRDLKGGVAKYINSPESQIYKKSNELYGIFQARGAITTNDKCYLVEGYLDVIGMWQSGLKNVVASSGTALTDGQIALIHRFTDNITLIYDGDAAGIKASLRGIDMLLNHKMKIKVLLLPDGDDPDSFALKHTPDEFKEYIEQHETDIIRFKAQVLMEDVRKDPQKRIEAINSMVTSLAHISDPVSRDVYIQECSRIMGVGEDTILKAVVRARGELSQKWKKEREYNQLRDNADPNIQPAADNAQNETSAQQTNVNNANTTSDNTISSPSVVPVRQQINRRANDSTLAKIEKKVMKYLLKYGYLDFCFYTDEQNVEHSINVVQWVNEEISDDDISFSVPVYARLFQLIKDLSDDFSILLQRKQIELEQEIETMRQNGIDDIRNKDLSFSGIETAEKQLEDRLNQHRSKSISDFSRDYTSRVLASHEDDEIREVVTDLILDKHQLSNIYYRDNNVIESEQDRLSHLMIRVMIEWKSEIINNRIREQLELLKTATAENNPEQIHAIQLQINSLVQARSQYAKDIGERVLSPMKL